MRGVILVVTVAMIATAGLAMAERPIANPQDPSGQVDLSKPLVPPTVTISVCSVEVDDDFDPFTDPDFGIYHFNRIQAAINYVCANCQSGPKKVIIHDGTYFRAWGFDNGAGNYDSTDTEPISIWCDSITVMGGSKPLIQTIQDSPTVFDPYNPPYVSGLRMMNIDADVVTVKGLYVNGKTGSDSYDGTYPDTFGLARSGILTFSGHDEITIQDCRVDSCVSGIATYDNVTNILVQSDSVIDCGVDGSLGTGIFFWGTGTRATATGNWVISTATDEYFMPPGIGFHLGASGTASYNTLQHLGFGIFANDNEVDCDFDNNTVDSAQIGIQILNSRDTVSIHHNTVTIDSTGDRPPYDGIDLLGSAPGTNISHPVYNNTITGDEDGADNTWGILMTDDFYWGMADTMKLDIHDNEITKCNYGVMGMVFNTSPSLLVDVNIYQNTIHDNYADGIFLADTGHTLWGSYTSIPITNVMISQNSTHDNGQLGIDLEAVTEADPGVTLNDTPYITDPDDGPNTLYNFPVLLGAVNIGGNSWQITGYAHPGDLVEFFLSDGDGSGYGEGETYLGNVYAGPSGSFVAFVSTSDPSPLFTATATDSSGNTSEFSAQLSGPTGAPEGIVIKTIPAAFEVINNPASDRALFRFALRDASPVTIQIFDASGRLVRNLLKKRFDSGYYKLGWDGTDNAGERVGSGIYFVSFKANGYAATQKVVMTRSK